MLVDFLPSRRTEMLKKTGILLVAAILVVFAFTCKKQTQIEGISLDLSFAEEQLTDNLITEMTCVWKTNSDFVKMSQDMNIFIHFWHDNNLLFQADYIPDPPTSSWEAGQEYSHTQRIYIPTFIDEFDPDFKGEETLRMSVGFFSPYDRAGESKQELMGKKLKVLPPPLDTPEIIYEEGWYNLEINPEAFLKQWRWMGQEAKCMIDNPHRDALLVIKGGVNLEALPGQKVMFKINNLMLDEFVPEDSSFEKSYNIKKEMLGQGDEFYLTIATDKTFVPAKLFPDVEDERELGLQISFIYFR
jgi:hypothetical protein